MQTTPLFPIYEKYSAKIVDFHGWALPVYFNGIIQEHLTVRQRVGLFDVSHMGELLVEGPDAPLFLDSVLTNRISTAKPGVVRYSPMCYENGDSVDDLLIYRLTETQFCLVSNASNTVKVGDWLNQNIRQPANEFKVTITDISLSTVQLAIQGPQAAAVLERIAANPDEILVKYYQYRDQVILAGIPVLLSRTGYTGEDGFEMYLPAAQGPTLWEVLMKAGSNFGIQPIGLGARDTLRFEAGLPLYGNELGPDITPIEANLIRFIDFEKEAFIGKTALQQQYNSNHYRHKTFATPHGGGSPGAGPVGVKSFLADFLPVPVLSQNEHGFFWDDQRSKSIEKVSGFYGNFAVLFKALAYIKAMGSDGLGQVSLDAVINANYLRVCLDEHYQTAYDRICMHEFVLSATNLPNHIQALDIAKRLMDFGIHPPTVYFPLIVPEALMIEPTETKDKATLDNFVAAMAQIHQEASDSPEVLLTVPHHTPVTRVDEAKAARFPKLRCSQ